MVQGAAGARGDIYADVPLEVDRDGIPRWNGDPRYADEWVERLWLRFHLAKTEDPAMLVMRLSRGSSVALGT